MHSLLKIMVIFFIFFSIEIDFFFLEDFLSLVHLFLSFLLLFFFLNEWYEDEDDELEDEELGSDGSSGADEKHRCCSW